MTTIVSVTDLPLSARVGINPDEIGRQQPLFVSIDLTLKNAIPYPTPDTAPDPTLADSVDYRRIVVEAERLAQGHIGMIETFARTLATRCLALGPVRTAAIRVAKPQALPYGLASVTVTLDAGD